MKKTTILVVDDDALIRGFLEDFLERFGYCTIACYSAEEALLYIEGADVLITDFQMPGMNGAEFAAVAKRQKPKLPILIVSGDISEIPHDHHADMVMEKPFLLSSVLLWLDEVVQRGIA